MCAILRVLREVLLVSLFQAGVSLHCMDLKNTWDGCARTFDFFGDLEPDIITFNEFSATINLVENADDCILLNPLTVPQYFPY